MNDAANTPTTLLELFAGSPADLGTGRTDDNLYKLVIRFRENREPMANATWRVGGRLSWPLNQIEDLAAAW